MPSSQPTVDKISATSGTEPSVGCDEGTVDSSLNEAPQFYYQIIIDGDFRWTVPNGVVLDRMVRKALGQDWSVEVELRDGQPG